MLAILELDLRDLNRLRKLVRRGKLRVVTMIVVAEVRDPHALGGFIANSSSKVVRQPIVLVQVS